MTPLELLRMMQLADSAFPSGGFAFSGGMEVLVQEGSIKTAADVEALIADEMLPRWQGIDRWYLIEAYAAVSKSREADAYLEDLIVIDRLCEAQSSCAPLADASRRMGRATLASTARIGLAQAASYQARLNVGEAYGHLPVVQGLAGASFGIPLVGLQVASLHALVMGALAAAVRMGKIGALGAQAALRRLDEAAAVGMETPPPLVPAAFTPFIDIAAARRSRLSVLLFSS